MKHLLTLIISCLIVTSSYCQDLTAKDTIPETQKQLFKWFKDNNTYRAYVGDSVYMVYEDSTQSFIVYKRHFGAEIIKNIITLNKNSSRHDIYLLGLIVGVVLLIIFQIVILRRLKKKDVPEVHEKQE